MSESGKVVIPTIPFYAGDNCPKFTAVSPMPRRSKPWTDYDPQLLTYSEAAQLLQVKSDIEEEQREAWPAVEGAMERVVSAENAARRGIGSVEEYADMGKLALAHETVHELRTIYAGDGPESRRHRPRWVAPALWITVVLAAAYDTAFLANIFLQMLDADWTWTSPTTYFALFPGVLIAVALLVAGHFAGEAFRRGRAHTERTPQRRRRRSEFVNLVLRRQSRPDPQKRSEKDMPWPRWAFAAWSLIMILGTLGIWAVIRGQVASTPDDKIPVLPEWPMAALVLLFSMTVIGIKILHHNPYRDRMTEVESELVATTREADALVAQMRVKLGEYVSAVNAMRAMASRFHGDAKKAVSTALIAIMRERHDHGLAGDTATIHALQASPEAPVWVFHGLVEPFVPVDLPDQMNALAASFDPASLLERAAAATDRLSIHQRSST